MIALKGVLGKVVMMTLALCSCSRRWLKTSMWSRPRNPSLQPWPRAGLGTRDKDRTKQTDLITSYRIPTGKKDKKKKLL